MNHAIPDAMNCKHSKVSDLDGLPSAVVEALEISAALAIKTLQGLNGLGLYEAKRAVDAYLERHPEHPLSQRSENSLVAPRGERAGALLSECITAEPVPAEAPVFDSLARVVVAPELYIFLREDVPCKAWLGEALKACVDAGIDMSMTEILDEELRNGDGDLSAAVLKLSGLLSNEAIRALPQTFRRRLDEGINFRLVRAAQWCEAAIPADELELEYFLHEFSRPSCTIVKTTSCVRLRHRPTGILCRSTAHRRRAMNYQEALLLLASLLKESRLGLTI